MTTTFRVATALLLALTLLGLRTVSTHAATTITVTDCSAESSSTGAGIGQAVTAASIDNANDVITFSCSGTIPITSTLNITGSMTIDGTGQNVILDGGNNTQLIYVNSGASLSVHRLTLSHGHTSSANTSGGAIHNLGTVLVISSTLSGNANSQGSLDGGAIANSGTLTIDNSILSGNANSSSNGGAIGNNGGTLTVTRSTFAGNTVSQDTSADSSGGAISNVSGATSIASSTFTGNQAYGVGGAIYNNGKMTITTSTVTNNSIYGEGAGAIYNNSQAVLTITNSTIASNNYYGIAFCLGSTWAGTCIVTLGGDIFDGRNAGGDCAYHYGVPDSRGYVIDPDQSCSGNYSNDPQLGPLTNNGGPTQTMALRATSPAIDQIPAGFSFTANGATFSLCPASGTMTDQRGASRPDDGETACDNGAYESGAKLPTTTSLRSSANPSIVGQSVTFTATVSPTPEGGTVAFLHDGTVPYPGCNAVAVDATTGKATCSVTYANATSKTITAVYSGDTDYTSSTSAPLIQTVQQTQSNSTTALNSSKNPSVAGYPVTYTATVTRTPDGGSVSFQDNGVSISGCGPVPVDTSTGTATCSVTYSGTGSHSITAIFSGSTAFRGSSSSSLTQTVVNRISIIVTDCSAETSNTGIGIAQAVAQADTDNGDDLITFACSGTIPITSTLPITGSMGIDGTGQHVTLDGGNTTEQISVNPGMRLALTSMSLSHGRSFAGGAMKNGGTVTIRNSTFSGNVSSNSYQGNPRGIGGGAIANYGTMAIAGSTFAGNSAAAIGGAIDNYGGTLTITTSTFANNSGWVGGAIHTSGTLTVITSTLNDDSASGYGSAIFNEAGKTTTLGSTIIGNDGCYDAGRNGTQNVDIIDKGYNINPIGTCAAGQIGDSASDPQLGALTNNGGPTQTMALGATSPAIDAIPAGTGFTANGATFSLCPATGGTTDQRGYARPDSGETTCDIGAYESGASQPTAARTSGLTVQRHGGTMLLRWRVLDSVGVVGFNLYAGHGRLNRAPIPVHRGHLYRYQAPWHRGPYSIRAIPARSAGYGTGHPAFRPDSMTSGRRAVNWPASGTLGSHSTACRRVHDGRAPLPRRGDQGTGCLGGNKG